MKLGIIAPVRTQRLTLVASMLLALGSAADARTHFAERYNSHVDVLRGGTLRVTASSTEMVLPPAVTAPPAAEQRQATARTFAGVWVLAACVVFVCGIALLFAIRQRYDPPAADLSPGTAWSMPPDTLPPAMAGMLLTNGSANLEQAMALIFSLADRGELRIEEAGRTLGQRSFAIIKTPTGRPLQGAEERALGIIFRTRQGEETSVSLGDARSRLTGHLQRLREVLDADMRRAGLIDPDRVAVRRRFLRAGAALLVGSGLLAISFAFLTERYGGWPMLVPLAIAMLGLVALIAYAALTPLSNEGVRRSNEWRGFRRYLRDVARDREAAPGTETASQLLSFAVALGVAHAWSSYVRRHRASVPSWFRAAGDSGANNSVPFAAFVASGGTGAGGHAHGAAGTGAARGGPSGAR